MIPLPRQVEIEFRQFHAGQLNIYKNRKPRTVLRCGRRFGKTTLVEDLGGMWALKKKKVGWFSPNYKLLTPSYKRIYTTLKSVVSGSSRTDGIIELHTGGSVEFWTLNDEDAGRSRSYDEVIIDEASLTKNLKEIWDKSIAPTLLDRRGNATMAGTPKGIDVENYFYAACTQKKLGWTEFHAPTKSNPMLDPLGVANLEKDYPPLVYQQEFLAEFVDWSGEAFFSLPSLLQDGKAVAYPKHCATVYAIIDTAVKTGKKNDGTFCTYFSYDPFNLANPLVVLDWDVVQIEGSLLEVWLPTVFARLNELAVACGARLGSQGAYIEDKVSGTILIQQAQRHNWPAHAIDSKLTAVGKDERAISVSGYVHQGKVKLSEHAYNKTTRYKGVEKNHFLSQVVGFRIGIKDQTDDGLDTFTYGVAIALGNQDGY